MADGPATPRSGHGGHSHGSLELTARSSRVSQALALLIGGCAVLAIIGAVVLWPRGAAPDAPGVIPGTIFVEGTVQVVETIDCPAEFDRTLTCATAEVEVTNGPTRGDVAELTLTRGLPGSPDLSRGDDIRMSYFAEGPEGFRYGFDDFQRSTPLALLAILFVVAVVALSRMQGVRALLGMGVSAVVLLGFLLPALLRGGPPVPVALVAAVLVALSALYLAHGIHVGTHVAAAGAVLALVLTMALGSLFIALCNFTGLTDENAASLTVAATDLDLRGLILAGLVIGALGVLDDVTVTQVSVVSEVRSANPRLRARDLYRSGLRTGRDHVASTVNTLTLAYAGASLPLLLLFAQGGRSIGGVLTSEIVAVEVVGALVGSIGLVAAVPITTGLAALVVAQGDDEPADPELLPDPDRDFWE